MIYVTRYEKTCHKSLFVEIALLVSTERSRSALFNGAKTKFVRYSVPELWTFIARTYENRDLWKRAFTCS